MVDCDIVVGGVQLCELQGKSGLSPESAESSTQWDVPSPQF